MLEPKKDGWEQASELKEGEEGPHGGSGLVSDGYRSPSMGVGRKGETDNN